MSKNSRTVYNIPAGWPFAKSLAKELLEDVKDSPESLSKIRILLPTRRACRVLREAFLQFSNKPLLLPHMQPLGDIDQEELSLSITDQEGLKKLTNLPPSISPLRRQILLAKTIQAIPEFNQGDDHALGLASALGHLMDQIYTENLKLANLGQLVPEEFAEHWQITLDFLQILSVHWPKVLEENGVIDIADRRNRLLLALNEHWQNKPPGMKIIAAGSTGSIPATAKLLSTVASLPKGQIILPGLDQDTDETSWNALGETHPQFGLKTLLEHMNIDRRDVKIWPGCEENKIQQYRHQIIRDVMQPAETTTEWANLATNEKKRTGFQKALKGLSRFDCEHEREEAETIAVLMRQTLEKPGKSAVLITPDRALARRTAATCHRWGIRLDDSAGLSLDQTSCGTFLRLVLQAAISNISPNALLALLKHKFCLLDSSGVQNLEILALRGLKPTAGFQGLYNRLKGKKNHEKSLALLQKLEPVLEPLLSLNSETHSFKDTLKSHISAAESLAGEALWFNEDGEAASNFFSELLEQASLLPHVTLTTYKNILDQLFKNITVRPAYGTHPRLMILGQLEARMIDADLVILGSLNEDSWPADPGHDPWMSRPMRKEFGLPSHERSIGLAAHDFCEAFCAPHVVMTRAKRSAGSTTIPSRWLQRLDTVLDAVGLSSDLLSRQPQLDWARNLDKQEEFTPYVRPEPRPPIDARPTELSATRIETWRKDPYSIYARYILKLKKLDPLEQPVDAALRGSILHEILDRFVSVHPDDLPENAEDILYDLAQDIIKEHHDDPAVWSFWWPRFSRLRAWYCKHEQEWRKHAKPLKTEIKGTIDIDNFSITAIADRLDQTNKGAAIIDYKSGGTFSLKAIKTGELPQLPIEALILFKGGFEDVKQTLPSSLSYWTLTGGNPPGKITQANEDMGDVLEITEQGLISLIGTFQNPETPYYSLPRPDNAPRYNDYEHLARIKEWSVQNTGEEAA